MNKIGKMLKIHCLNEGIDQKKLADKIGIGSSTLSRIMKGKSPDFDNGLKLMAWLFQQEPTTEKETS